MSNMLRQIEDQAWTVSYFVNTLDQKLESFGNALICGEISQCRPGYHLYFTIKDESSSLECVMFTNQLKKLNFKPAVGQKVLVSGKCSVYNKTGKLSLKVEIMELTGIGQFMAQLEQLERQLRQEGVIPRRPLPVPRHFSKVVVVTSKSGDVCFDIFQTVLKRYPGLKLSFIDTKVQGPGAPESIVNSLGQAYQLALSQGYDAVILARGGGSFEDLLCFSDERVVRMVASSPVFIISAIGHDRDSPLCDVAADVRVSTPTAAGQFVTPVTVDDLLSRLAQLTNRADNLILRRIDETQDHINRLADRLFAKRTCDGYLSQIALQQRQVENLSQRLDSRISAKLTETEQRLQRLQNSLDRVPERLQPFQERLRSALTKLDFSFERSDRLPRNFDVLTKHAAARIDSQYHKLEMLYSKLVVSVLEQYQDRFRMAVLKLEALNPVKQLQHGLSVTTSDGEHVIDDAKLEEGQELITFTKQSKIHSKITKIEDFNPLEVLEQEMPSSERKRFEQMFDDLSQVKG